MFKIITIWMSSLALGISLMSFDTALKAHGLAYLTNLHQQYESFGTLPYPRDDRPYNIAIRSPESMAPSWKPSTPLPPGEWAVMVRVVDGDTIVVRTQAPLKQTLRLIGLDTPETVHPRKPVQCYGPEASEWLSTRLPPGTQIWIGYEPRLQGGFGRTAAYIFLPVMDNENPDGTTGVTAELVNVKLLYEGYARVVTKWKFRYRDLFVEAERLAKEAGRGLWTACKEI